MSILQVLHLNVVASILILVIIVVRQLAIHKLPKNTFMVLWAVVLLRLLIPFSINLPVPVQPTVVDVGVQQFLQIAQPVPPPSITNYNPGYTQRLPGQDVTYNQQAAARPYIPPAIIWVSGMLAVALFILVAHLRSRKEYRTSLPLNNSYVQNWLSEQKGMRTIHARQSDRIATPLTYGILRPVILFPKTINWEDTMQLQYILTHEMTHIKRFDILTKWLLAIVLCVHWFNPLVWVMYILANRDIELSCDEAVVKGMGESKKSTYAMTLIGLEEHKSIFAPLCTSFSKKPIEERIVSIMKIKKRSVVSIALAAVLVAALTVGALTAFASNTRDDQPYGEFYGSPYTGAKPATPHELYIEAIPAEEENDPGDWSEWLEWFNSLTPEEQAYVSVRPPLEVIQPIYETPVDFHSPYRIARTMEEVYAAWEDGLIPLTNLDIRQIRHHQADGVIIFEQCLYEALDVLHQAYAQGGPPLNNLVTVWVEMQPHFEELPDFQQMLMISHEFFFTAMSMGLVDVSHRNANPYSDEEIDLRRAEAWRLLELYNGEFPSDESIREVAQRLYGE